MLNVKKVISMALTLSIFLAPISSISNEVKAFEIPERCLVETKKGNYWDVGCARSEVKNAIVKGAEDYVALENLGPMADVNYYYFNFKALDKILETIHFEKKDDLRKEINNIKKEKEIVCAPITTKAKNLLLSLSALFGGAIGAVTGFFKNKKQDEATPSKELSKSSESSKGGSTALTNAVALWDAIKPYAGRAVVGATLIAALATLGLGIDKVYRDLKSDAYDSQLIYFHEKENDNKYKSLALKDIQDSIIEEQLYPKFDILYIYGGKGRTWNFSSKKFGLNYTEEEKAKFNDAFAELSENITKAIREYL